MMSGEGFDWFDDDDLDATKITDAAPIHAKLARESSKDRPYLILLTGSEVGKIFRLDEGVTTIGRSHRANLRLDDDSISRLHCRVHLDGRQVEAEDMGSSNGTFVNGGRITRTALNDGDKIRVGEAAILKFSFHDKIDENFQQHMYDAALRDGLTKAYNKRFFLDALVKEMKYAHRHGGELCLLMLDLDHFKNINDTYGHIAGDVVLVQIAELTLKMLRTEDVFARYGGEEFGVITRGINLDQAGVVAERLRQTVETTRFMNGDQRLPVAVSVGVAMWQTAMLEPEDLIEAADAALYEAKRTGRNRVLLNRRASTTDVADTDGSS